MTLRRGKARWLLPPVAAYLLLLVDWRGAHSPASPPVVQRAFAASGPLQAGAARVRLDPPLPVVRGGYRMPRAVAVREHDPLEVRALVVRTGGKSVALVLADVVLVPDAVSERLEQRLAKDGLTAVFLAATHTHSSVGGLDSRVLAQVVGMGRYRPDVVERLLDRAEEAVHQALRDLVPVQVRTAQTRLAGWAENRSTPGDPVDDALTVAELETEAGRRVASLAVVAGHPTLLPRTTPELSAEYPGVAMRQLEAGGGVSLLLQGAAGDARPRGSGEMALAAAGGVVARGVTESARTATVAPDRLEFAEVQIGLPAAEPQAIRPFLLRRPASNLLQLIAPRSTRVVLLTLGNVTLLAVPGEPTALAAGRMMASLPKADLGESKVRIVSLTQGYVGYIDTPERVREGRGEGWRAYFAPELIDAVAAGLRAAVSSVRGRS
jgi:neutral ceramidase